MFPTEPDRVLEAGICYNLLLLNRKEGRRGEPEHTAPRSWQKNLAASFAAEFLTMTAFSFVNPLFPLYVQQVGNFTAQAAAFWAGIAASGLSIAMFFISPVWGLVADRLGRKSMVMRSMFGGALVLSLMGLAPNLYMVIGLRWVQGFLTGSVAAMTALAGSTVPRNRLAFAMGIVMLGVYSGQSLGPLLGGFVADHLGYHITFYASGALLFLSGIIVLALVREHFERPKPGQAMSLRGMLDLARSPQLLPLLLLMCLFSVAQSTVAPIVSLRIKELLPNGDAATFAGLTFSLIGVAAATSAVVGGRLGGRISLKTLVVASSIAVGLLYVPPVWARSAAMLAILLMLPGFLLGSLMTSSNAMVGLSVDQGHVGIAYGLSQSASSLGMGLGPLIGGGLAAVIGLSPIFGIAAAIYVMVGLTATRLLSERTGQPKPLKSSA